MEALKYQAQLRGLPCDSCLLREDAITDKKPISIFHDQHFEEMCNPTKYPTGKFGLTTNRNTKLTACKYFNQKLLDAVGSFARDIEYLLTVQYDVESKQVDDDASIAVRQAQGRLHRGQVLTTGFVRNQQVINEMI